MYINITYNDYMKITEKVSSAKMSECILTYLITIQPNDQMIETDYKL